MKEQNETMEHSVVVDPYMTIVLKIPKTLSVLDLEALMEKSRKMLRLGNVPILDKQNGNRKKREGDWTEEECKKMTSLVSTGMKTKDVAKELNKTIESVYNKKNYLKKQGRWNK